MDFALEYPEEIGPVDTLILADWDPFWTSDLQDCKLVNFLLFEDIKRVVICYSSSRKPISTATQELNVKARIQSPNPKFFQCSSKAKIKDIGKRGSCLVKKSYKRPRTRWKGSQEVEDENHGMIGVLLEDDIKGIIFSEALGKLNPAFCLSSQEWTKAKQADMHGY